MHDFTKEELIIILGLLKGAYSASLPGPELKADKIKALIDNYCEHDPKGDWHVCVDKCTKCGVICE